MGRRILHYEAAVQALGWEIRTYRLVMIERRLITVSGVVQGVGFRPFVLGLAVRAGLSGFVGNDGDGVFIEIEGPTEAIERFVATLAAGSPPLARIDGMTVGSVPVRGGTGFEIVPSMAGTGRAVLVSPDVRTCDDCLRELSDPTDRRYRYPFINCTNCGPRFTITIRTPYDRPQTTMAEFTMCGDCRREYEDPADRRFHAQPNACPACGPRLWIEGGVGSGDAIAETRELVAGGSVVAIRGVGGFHLACNAFDGDAIAALRERKGRIDKPFAVMAGDLDTVRLHTLVDDHEERLLTGRERPIVLLRKREGSGLAHQVAPGIDRLGVMLPYSPVHELLLQPGDVWVMTSGNLGGEPIVTGIEQARRQLSRLADAFLMHDREIHVPVDDSVVRSHRGAELPVRRSRGYAPFPVRLPVEVGPVLAVGGELKATFCLARGRDAFMSQHIGDMENLETLEAFERAVRHVKGLFRLEPERVVADLHPGYLSSRWAEGLGLPVTKVQHHHAHVASVMAENGVTDPVLGFSFDGTGYGTDGAVWGGEVLVCDFDGFERVAHLAYVPLAGGDASIERPYRMALSHMRSAGVAWTEGLPPVSACPPDELSLLARQLERGLGTVATSSMGRLFDAVASLVGVRHRVTYEAQAAMELESLAAGAIAPPAFAFTVDDRQRPWLIETSGLIAEIASDRSAAAAKARSFHEAVAEMIAHVALRACRETGLDTVGFSGGVFQNALLLYLVVDRLESSGLRLLTHTVVPPNDGGLALGQVVIGG